jgi:hypothetical protein
VTRGGEKRSGGEGGEWRLVGWPALMTMAGGSVGAEREAGEASKELTNEQSRGSGGGGG